MKAKRIEARWSLALVGVCHSNHCGALSFFVQRALDAGLIGLAFTQTDKGVVPPRTMNLRNFFEYTAESVYGMVEGAMGEKNAARFQ